LAIFKAFWPSCPLTNCQINPCTKKLYGFGKHQNAFLKSRNNFHTRYRFVCHIYVCCFILLANSIPSADRCCQVERIHFWFVVCTSSLDLLPAARVVFNCSSPEWRQWAPEIDEFEIYIEIGKGMRCVCSRNPVVRNKITQCENKWFFNLRWSFAADILI